MEFLSTNFLVGERRIYVFMEGGFGFLIVILVSLSMVLGTRSYWRGIALFFVGWHLFALIGLAIAGFLFAIVGGVGEALKYLVLQIVGGLVGLGVVKAAQLIVGRSSGLRS
ncbi:MAG: hypothetical protein IOC58_07160 [Methylobacterium sp.]|jgi:hypothetical protein|nr:hypothetical protein [Methylobacterium sp.]MCA3612539.1 hypothetical protein [Methylobacterium sp.]MCA3624128.1 hypothetical protein [Methylobacterium sp.]MCA3627861.1 hypothetical protein [Methylobacterium sp.]